MIIELPKELIGSTEENGALLRDTSAFYRTNFRCNMNGYFSN